MTGAQRLVYVGTDGGATTSKMGAVWGDGTTVSTRLLQRPTESADGPQAVVDGWVEGITEYSGAERADWEQVGGVGLAIPGPFQRYGVFDRSPNLPASFAGFDVHTAYAGALAERAGRAVPLIVGNDGNMGGVAEAQRVRGHSSRDRPDAGARLRPRAAPSSTPTACRSTATRSPGMEAAHMPAPLHLLGAKPYPCGCGRTWGCVEVYTTLSGLPHLLAERPARRNPHRGRAEAARRSRLRGLAQKGDPLAWRSSTSRPARWACTSPPWRWRSTRRSWSSAAA